MIENSRGEKKKRSLKDGFDLKNTSNGLAFISCPKDKAGEVTVPDGVTKIEKGAFIDCTNLTSVNMPKTVTKIGSWAFYGCTSLANINIPDSVTEIGECAFNSCNLKQITIPANTTDIDFASVFRHCSNIEIEIDEDNSAYCVVDDVVYSKDMTELIFCPKWKEEVKIPESVTEIGTFAFESCTSLTSINIPDGVTKIGYGAFYGCTSLANINIPEGVTEIAPWSFGGCASLTSINIPISVTKIRFGAFYGCRSLKEINIPARVTEIEGEVFACCDENLVVNYMGESMSAMQFYELVGNKNKDDGEGKE